MVIIRGQNIFKCYYVMEPIIDWCILNYASTLHSSAHLWTWEMLYVIHNCSKNKKNKKNKKEMV